MFFQTPRPFGQHSTAYRPFGTIGTVRSATSLTDLPLTEREDSRKSVPPIEFATTGGGRTYPRQSRGGQTNGSTVGDGSTTWYSDKQYNNNSTEERDAQSDHETSIPTKVNQHIFRVRRCTSLQQQAFTEDLNDWSGDAAGLRIGVGEWGQKKNIAGPPGQAVNPTYHQSNSEHRIVRNVPINEIPTPDHRSMRSSSAVPFQVCHQNSYDPTRPQVCQQMERHKNYATLHHVAAVQKFGGVTPLKRRTSDPDVLKVIKYPPDGTIAAPSIAMYNVAKGVRAELELDPKFRHKAEALAEAHTSFTNGRCARTSPPKQSPSTQQMQQFFANVQQLRTELQNDKRKPATPAPTPLPKTFNVEHVRSIFYSPTNQPNEMPPSSSYVLVSKPSQSILENAVKSAAVSHGREQVPSSTFNTSEYQSNHSVESKSVVSRLGHPWFTSSPNPVAENYKSDLLIPLVRAPKPLNSAQINSQSRMSTSVTGIDTERELLKLLRDPASTSNSGRPWQMNRSFPVDGSPNSCDGSADTNPPGPPQSVMQYDDQISEQLDNLLKISAEIGGDVQAMAQKLSSLFAEQRNFIWTAAGEKEPSPDQLRTKMGSIVRIVEDIANFKDSKRNTSYFNHISAISEGAQAIIWLTVKPAPAPYIKDVTEAAMFFINRVLKDHKDDQLHTNWAKTLSNLLSALQKYVKQVHTTGLVWNSSPGTKPPLSKSVNTVPASATNAPPPPPPPPVLPPGFSLAETPKSDGDNTNRDALFAEINAGQDITKRLKKVTDDMKTHKNPELRAKNADVSNEQQTGKLATTFENTIQQSNKPAKIWLEDDKRWNVEFHKNDKNIVLEVGSMKQAVYVYKCENSVLQVKGKVNSITIDNCLKTSVVFESILSQVEIINSKGIQIQTLGAMPLLSIQKTDGCQVYLSKQAINAEIITSKSSEMNILVPAAEDGDFVEYPVPEQFRTVFDGKKLSTTISEIV